MYLLVNPDGSRWWRFKYRIAGREEFPSLGVYLEVTLKRARGATRRVFRYAIATDRAERDVAADLKGALRSPVARNFTTNTDPARTGSTTTRTTVTDKLKKPPNTNAGWARW